MKDITAILVLYSDRTGLLKAFSSMKKIDARLSSVIVVQGQESAMADQCYDQFDRIEFITLKNNDLGNMLNHIVRDINSPYVLFLHDSDYLSSNFRLEHLELPQPKTILGTFYYNRNIAIYRPLLVRTAFLKNKPFIRGNQVPFNEAFFPAWLFNKEVHTKIIEDDIVKQSRVNRFPNTMEKQNFIQKYQLSKVKTENPSLSILVANYNMGKYVETAIASSLFQNEQPEQLLIMDDGSTDHSYEQLLRWDDGKQVRVLRKENEGKAKALNGLLPYVTSEFILELDADDWLDPDAIAVIKKQLSNLSSNISVLYGNFRNWKQIAGENDVIFKGNSKGRAISGWKDLLAYRFPLGPRIYRTSILKREGGFPVIEYENGRLYEDVTVLTRLIKNSQFCYRDFTVYNIREHKESITKIHHSKWNDFLKTLYAD